MFPTSAYQIILPKLELNRVDRMHSQVLRRDFATPGFALLQFSEIIPTSERLRAFMVLLKQVLGEHLRNETGRHLVYLSLARFDQQVTTKFHLDGSPDEALLILGYEPSEVPSELAIADYTKLAHHMAIEPKRFLAEFNPMFRQNAERLAPYVIPLNAFDPKVPQVLLINNSSMPFREDRSTFQGVMHQATILKRIEGASRVVNSMMLGIAETDESSVTEAAVSAFLGSQKIAGY